MITPSPRLPETPLDLIESRTYGRLAAGAAYGMKTARTKIGIGYGAVVLLCALAGCGGSGTLEASRLSGLSILEKTKPLDQNLVKQSDIAKASDASGVKTLLQFWQAMQYQDYESARNFFYPALANFVGIAQLTLALKNEGALWSSTKPKVVEATTKGHTARVIFVIDNLLGKETPVTVSFRKLGTEWTINYLTLLDEALRAWAQQRTQLTSPANSSRAVKEGLAAGIRAFQLQSLYLEREHSEKAKASVRGSGESNSATTVVGGRAARTG